MRYTILFLILLPLTSFAQDISGIWKGSLQTEGSKLTYEIAISKTEERYTGYALTIFNFDGKENIGIKAISLKIKSGRILIEDEELVYHNYSSPPRRIKLFADLWFSNSGPTPTLKGEFFTRTLDFATSHKTSYKGSVSLQRSSNDLTLLTEKLKQLNLLSGLSFMKPQKNLPVDDVKSNATVTKTTKPGADFSIRKTEIIQTILFTSDSLVLSLYDNGEVDGDSVSVLLNGEVIIANQGLKTTAISKTIYIPSNRGDSLQLLLYAENLGAIPPNTGLLIINDGGKRHEVRFAGDLQKSSAIVLKRQQKKTF